MQASDLESLAVGNGLRTQPKIGATAKTTGALRSGAEDATSDSQPNFDPSRG